MHTSVVSDVYDDGGTFNMKFGSPQLCLPKMAEQ